MGTPSTWTLVSSDILGRSVDAYLNKLQVWSGSSSSDRGTRDEVQAWLDGAHDSVWLPTVSRCSTPVDGAHTWRLSWSWGEWDGLILADMAFLPRETGLLVLSELAARIGNYAAQHRFMTSHRGCFDLTRGLYDPGKSHHLRAWDFPPPSARSGSDGVSLWSTLNASAWLVKPGSGLCVADERAWKQGKSAYVVGRISTNSTDASGLATTLRVAWRSRTIRVLRQMGLDAIVPESAPLHVTPTWYKKGA